MLVGDLLESGRILFNEERFFEAHEVWEDLWRETPSPVRVCYQGLIQAAVGLHHLQRGNLVGARGMLRKSLRNLRGNRYAQATGLDISDLEKELENLGDKLERDPSFVARNYPRIVRLE